MSDAKLWIDEAGCTATIAGVNVNYTMPLWVFDVMRDIIMTEAEKKVEVTHRDFDIQQELLDRYRAENAKLRERIHELEMEGSDHFYRTAYAEDANRTLEAENARLRERHAKTFEVGKRWMAKAARFESENTKLRELVADAWGYISHPANATWTHEKRKEVRHSLSDRMRELGVEVPDGD